MTIYVVSGSTGEYSDQEEWMVEAFRDEDSAKELVINASARAREIQFSCSETGYYLCSKGKNEFDPKMEMSYTGTYYTYTSIELVE